MRGSRIYFREWEQMINGGKRAWYKAVGDARFNEKHWTCAMDVDVESHYAENIGLASKGWHLFDDMRTLSSHVKRGWEETREDRQMVIYSRAKGVGASRPLSHEELEGEKKRNVELRQILDGTCRHAGWEHPIIHPPDAR
jgi:hypothetical protein